MKKKKIEYRIICMDDSGDIIECDHRDRAQDAIREADRIVENRLVPPGTTEVQVEKITWTVLVDGDLEYDVVDQVVDPDPIYSLFI